MSKCRECEAKDAEIKDLMRDLEKAKIDHSKTRRGYETELSIRTSELRVAEDALRSKSKELDEFKTTLYQINMTIRQLQSNFQQIGFF